MRISLLSMMVLASVIGISPSNASIVVVDAALNSVARGVAADVSGAFTVGERLDVTVSPTDLWSAGELPRWSNANGLIGPDLIATGADESGAPAGTVIGSDLFGRLTFGGLTAPYGSLVGELGGTYRYLGTSFHGTAWASGALNLYYWDGNFDDNTGSIAVQVTGAPEPSTWAMLILGFAGLGLMSYRRKNTPVQSAS